MSPSGPLDRAKLDYIKQSAQSAQRAISLAGTLTDTDPEAASRHCTEASGHCLSVLTVIAESGSTGWRDQPPEAACQGYASNVDAIYWLLSKLNRDRSTTESTAAMIERGIRSKGASDIESGANVVDRAADLCTIAVEQAVLAHSLAVDGDLKDAVWTAVTAAVEALYYLISIGAKAPEELEFSHFHADF